MIAIDMSDLVPHELMAVLSDTMVGQVLDTLAASARAKWIRLAQTELHSTAQTYIEGLSEVGVEDAGARVIELFGWLPNAIENGLDPFDMRETLLEGPAAQMAEDGHMYARIPFRHGTPKSTGLAGTPMGAAYGPRGARSRAAGSLLDADGAKAFGTAVYKLAKKLRTKVGAGTSARLSERRVAAAYASAGGKGSPLLRQHHKSSIYAGMKRERKVYSHASGKKTTQSQYVTFRTISEANPVGWQHPGIEARSFSDRVASFVAELAPRVIKQIVSGAAKGV